MSLPAWLRNREIIWFDDSRIGLRLTHWSQKPRSWEIEWSEIRRIEAMRIEPVELGLILRGQDEKWRFISDRMEGWEAALRAIQSRFPGFSDASLIEAEAFVDTAVPCWPPSEA